MVAGQDAGFRRGKAHFDHGKYSINSYIFQGVRAAVFQVLRHLLSFLISEDLLLVALCCFSSTKKLYDQFQLPHAKHFRSSHAVLIGYIIWLKSRPREALYVRNC